MHGAHTDEFKAILYRAENCSDKTQNINNHDGRCETQPQRISSISTLEHVKSKIFFETPSIQGVHFVLLFVLFFLSLYQPDLQISSL